MAIEGEIDLDLFHGGVLIATDRHQVVATGPADATSDVEEGDAGNDEVTGVAEAAIHDQVGQAISAAGGLAVHREASLGLVGGGSSGALLEAGALSAGGQTGHIGFGHRGEAEDQQGGNQNSKEAAHRVQLLHGRMSLTDSTRVVQS